MIDIHALLATLAVARPVFHSEADFQHALAWELHRQHPDWAIRLERPTIAGAGTRMYVDLWAEADGGVLALELKHKTRRAEVTHAGEHFHLLNQGAQDIGRYDVIKDIWRLEQVARAFRSVTAWLIFLTNDSSYWAPPAAGSATVDAGFRLHDGRVLAGECCWGEHAGAGTTRGRTSALNLTGSYRLIWHPYSVVAHGEAAANPGVPPRSTTFRYLAIRVTPPVAGPE